VDDACRDEDGFEEGLEAVLVDVDVYKTLADESASKIVFTEDVVLLAAFAGGGRGRGRVVDGDEEFAFQHDVEGGVAKAVFGVATGHADKRVRRLGDKDAREEATVLSRSFAVGEFGGGVAGVHAEATPCTVSGCLEEEVVGSLVRWNMVGDSDGGDGWKGMLESAEGQ
jgi:hypothetical protein